MSRASYKLPWVLPQRGPFRTQLYVPSERDLPEGDFRRVGTLRALVYDFLNPGLGPMETQERSFPAEMSMLIWGITGVNGQNPVDPAGGYLLQFYHTHNNRQRQFFNKHLSSATIVGTAQRPFLLRSPYLVAAGDYLECEVKNLSSAANNALVQVVLWATLVPEVTV